MIQIWQVRSECGPSNLVVLELDRNKKIMNSKLPNQTKPAQISNFVS